MVNLEELPWCSPCQEPHLEEECPRREEDSLDSINFINTIFSFQDDGDDNSKDITQEQLDGVRKRGAIGRLTQSA
jgi:hypothetical protein